MTVDVQSHFDRFDEKITLGGEQVRRMDSASATLRDFLSEKIGIPSANLFEQGSYANGTAIEPTDGGEYDVDIVCICELGDGSADGALDALTEALASSGNYVTRIDKSRPACVRLEYAEDDIGKFHVDVVPVRPGQDGAPLDAPRRQEGWHGTAPQEYTDWCRRQGVLFARTVKAVKRWRDQHQSVRGAIKSIVLQVLVAECMPTTQNSDAERLAETLRNLQSRLSGEDSPICVTNPVLSSENLARRWSQAEYDEFKVELEEAVELADRAVAADDIVEAVEAWRELLGDDFPAKAPSEFGIKLSDYSHAASPGQRGWTVDLDPRYIIEVQATEQRGKRSKKIHRYPSNGPLLFAGKKLCFRARTAGPGDAEVWWQVANTGAHARERGGLRGDYFKAKKLSGKPNENELENWEDTSYTGAHWIRAVLVKDGRLVAETDRFVVNVYNNTRWFGL